MQGADGTEHTGQSDVHVLVYGRCSRPTSVCQSRWPEQCTRTSSSQTAIRTCHASAIPAQHRVYCASTSAGLLHASTLCLHSVAAVVMCLRVCHGVTKPTGGPQVLLGIPHGANPNRKVVRSSSNNYSSKKSIQKHCQMECLQCQVLLDLTRRRMTRPCILAAFLCCESVRNGSHCSGWLLAGMTEGPTLADQQAQAWG